MPGFKAHLAGGAFVLAAALAASYYCGFLPKTSALIYAPLFLLIGALLPDIDSRTSKPHQIFVVIVAASAALVAYATLTTNERFALSIAAAVVAFLLMRKLLPRHRGIIHSPLAAPVYAALAALAGVALGFESNDAAFIGAFALAGYATHLAMDAASSK